MALRWRPWLIIVRSLVKCGPIAFRHGYRLVGQHCRKWIAFRNRVVTKARNRTSKNMPQRHAHSRNHPIVEKCFNLFVSTTYFRELVTEPYYICNIDQNLFCFILKVLKEMMRRF